VARLENKLEGGIIARRENCRADNICREET
jgi:hypothetical protein